MAEKVSINLNLKTVSDENKSKAIVDINPNASDGEIYALAQAINSVTTNTLRSVTRVATRTVENITRANVVPYLEAHENTQEYTDVNETGDRFKYTFSFGMASNNYATISFGIEGSGGEGGITALNDAIRESISLIPVGTAQVGVALYGGDNVDLRFTKLGEPAAGSGWKAIVPQGSFVQNDTTYYYNAFEIEFVKE